MTLPHPLTSSQIDILLLARGGHRPAPGRNASPHRQDCALLLAVGLIEWRRGTLALTARGGAFLAGMDGADGGVKPRAAADPEGDAASRSTGMAKPAGGGPPCA